MYFTGGSLNPARSLGPAIINRSFPGYFWIYFIGPGLGSLLASFFYWGLKQLHWQECNPNQDWDGMEKGDSHFQPLASQNGQHSPVPKESHSQHVPSVPSTAGN